MSNTREWDGLLAAVLGTKLYKANFGGFPKTDTAAFEQQVTATPLLLKHGMRDTLLHSAPGRMVVLILGLTPCFNIGLAALLRRWQR